MNTLIVYTGILLFLTLCSCKEDAVPELTDYPFVILSEVNDITSDGATFRGNITNLGSQKILDYGFVWDEGAIKPTINNIVKSCGNNAISGEYSYRVTNDLKKEKTFSVRAYVKTDKVIVYSNTLSFISEGCLPPVINSFYPDSGSAGRIITIIGKNFSSRLKNNIIYFGTTPAKVVKSNTDTLLVQCPNISQTESLYIEINVATQQSKSFQKFKLICPWNQLQDFPGGARFNSSYFTIGTKGYVCLGMENMRDFSSTVIWEYNSITKNWNQKSAFPGNKRCQAISFSMSGKGYIGLGYYYNINNDYTFFKDLYEYDPSTDQWTKKADFPGVYWGYFKLVYFIINSKLYLYSSDNGGELWLFDPQLNEWAMQPKQNEINNRYFSGFYNYNNLGYLIESTGTYSNLNYSTVWKFNPNSLSTSESYYLPKTSDAWFFGDCFIIDNCLYVPYKKGEFWQYGLKNQQIFYVTAPTNDFSINFIFSFLDKVVLGKSESDLVYEFYPR